MIDNSETNLDDKEITVDITINSKVKFNAGKVAELLRKLEKLLGVSLSIRSTTGEVVCKTDYCYGPCSYIRGTELGCKRCRKVYSNIGKKILMRKVPYACFCYCGFLIFAVPLNFRGEMIGILVGSQIIPVSSDFTVSDFCDKYKRGQKILGLNNNKVFLDSFTKVKTLDNNSQRLKFLYYLEEVSKHFVSMALEEKTWNAFLKEIKVNIPEFGNY